MCRKVIRHGFEQAVAFLLSLSGLKAGERDIVFVAFPLLKFISFLSAGSHLHT